MVSPWGRGEAAEIVQLEFIMQHGSLIFGSTMAELVAPHSPILGVMNPNMGMIEAYSAKVGPRHGVTALPSLLPLFKGNYLFSLSMLPQVRVLGTLQPRLPAARVKPAAPYHD